MAKCEGVYLGAWRHEKMDICCDIFSEIGLGVNFRCSILKRGMVENSFWCIGEEICLCAIIKCCIPENTVDHIQLLLDP